MCFSQLEPGKPTCTDTTQAETDTGRICIDIESLLEGLFCEALSVVLADGQRFDPKGPRG